MTSREDIYEIVRLNPSICVNEILPMVECGKSGVLRMLEGYIKYGMIRKGEKKTFTINIRRGRKLHERTNMVNTYYAVEDEG